MPKDSNDGNRYSPWENQPTQPTSNECAKSDKQWYLPTLNLIIHLWITGEFLALQSKPGEHHTQTI